MKEYAQLRQCYFCSKPAIGLERCGGMLGTKELVQMHDWPSQSTVLLVLLRLTDLSSQSHIAKDTANARKKLDGSVDCIWNPMLTPLYLDTLDSNPLPS